MSLAHDTHLRSILGGQKDILLVGKIDWITFTHAAATEKDHKKYPKNTSDTDGMVLNSLITHDSSLTLSSSV